MRDASLIFGYVLVNRTPVPANTLEEVAMGLKDIATRTVCKTHFDAIDVSVSTVFLVTDHNFSGYGEPVLFETMVFGGVMDEHTERYCTWEEAEAGHERIVQMVAEAELNAGHHLIEQDGNQGG